MHRACVNDTVGPMKMTRMLTMGTVLAISGLLIMAAAPALAVSDRKIEDARYACTTFMKGEAEKSRPKDLERAQLARFWLISFLTGAYEADAVLEFSDHEKIAEGDIVGQVKDYCAEHEEVSIHAAAVHAGELPRPLPGTTNIGFDPRLYSCAAYSAGRESRGDEKDRAKAAEFWAFAFVQGNISVRYHPRLVVSISNKRKIVRALKQSCARNPTRNLLDQTAEIANRVKPKWTRNEWD